MVDGGRSQMALSRAVVSGEEEPASRPRLGRKDSYRLRDIEKIVDDVLWDFSFPQGETVECVARQRPKTTFLKQPTSSALLPEYSGAVAGEGPAAVGMVQGQVVVHPAGAVAQGALGRLSGGRGGRTRL